MKWVLIVCTIFASSTGDILCAKGMSQGRELGNFRPTGILHTVQYIATRRLVILGYLSYAVAFVSLMGLLSVAQLTVAVPATALSFVVDTLGARFILHERIPWKRWLGVCCVTVGVLLAIRPGPAAPPLARPTGTNCTAVQPCKDQPGHNHPRTEHLHE